MGKWSEKIPSILWIPIIVGAAALFVGALIGGFYVVTHVEWVGSIVLLVIGGFAFWLAANTAEMWNHKFGIAIAVLFFAALGLAFDAPGNFVYNAPMRWIFCPANTRLASEVAYRALNDGVSVDRNFACLDGSGNPARQITTLEQLAFRFVEYVLIGYALLYASRLFRAIKNKRAV